MAKQPSISNVAAKAACDAILNILDISSEEGIMRIYSGTQPANTDTAIGGQVVLAELGMSGPAFPPATDATPGAVATANTINTSIAIATGLAKWFRLFAATGIAVLDGSVGLTDADAIIDATSIQQGTIVQCISFKYTFRET